MIAASVFKIVWNAKKLQEEKKKILDNVEGTLR